MAEQSTAWIDRFADALTLLCGGRRPSAEIVAAWFDADADDMRLQAFCCDHCPLKWHQGIAVIDAAHVLADQPEEGEGHEPKAVFHG